MLFGYTLEDLISFAVMALCIVAVINVLITSENSTRYYLTDGAGNISASVFTRSKLHESQGCTALYFRMFVNSLTGLLAAIAFAAMIAGTIRGNINDINPGGVVHVLFIWFALMQLKRVVVEQYILRTIKQVRPRVVKIDGNQHYISTIKKLPWLVTNRMLFGTAVFFSVVLFVNLF